MKNFSCSNEVWKKEIHLWLKHQSIENTLPPEHIQPDFSVTRLFAFDSWCTHIWHEFYQFSKSFVELFLRNRIFCVFLVDFHSARLFFAIYGAFVGFFGHFFWVRVGWGWAWVNSKFLHFVRFCIFWPFLAFFGIFWVSVEIWAFW